MFVLKTSVLLCLLTCVNCSRLLGNTLIGQLCFDSLECVGIPGETSFCDTSSVPPTCTCLPDYTSSILNDNCLKISNIGDTCTEHNQCKQGLGGEWSDCLANDEETEKICQCNDEAIVIEVGIGFTCLRKATVIGDPCDETAQCTPNLGELSECNNGACSCTIDAVENDHKDKCLQRGILIGNPCEVDAQCVGESGTSGCSSGICVCAWDYVSSNNRDECLPIRNQVGEPCKEIQQCQQGEMGRLSECTGTDPNHKVCECSIDAISVPGNNLCRRKATLVGDSCEIEAQCLFLGYSECLDDICICKDGAVAASDKSRCLMKSYLGEPCEDITQCTWMTGANCQLKDEDDPESGKVCKCLTGFVNVEFARDVCYLKTQYVGDSCNLHPIQCIDLYGSQCLRDKKICACHEPTQIVTPDKKRCLPRP